jgi:hypothetical protein
MIRQKLLENNEGNGKNSLFFSIVNNISISDYNAVKKSNLKSYLFSHSVLFVNMFLINTPKYNIL